MGHKKLVITDPSQDYPDFLKHVHQSPDTRIQAEEPVVIRMEHSGAEQELEQLIAANPGLTVVDNYAEQYAELLLSKNAHLYQANSEVQIASIATLLEEHYGRRQPWKLGSWVFFPWRQELVHVLTQEDFEALRTIRNRDLITAEEQKALFAFDTVCFGMSVGSAGALALGISGISRRIKLVDGAVISGSNLNRIMTGVSSVGLPKALVIGRQLYEMNPYAGVAYFDKVTGDNIAAIFDEPWPVRLAIDEIDDIEMKVRIRAEARSRKIPVVMATELGDTIMLDIERFDLEPNRPLFHNLVPDIERLLAQPPENHREWMKHAVRIIDPRNMPMKMQQSLLKIGSTIVTHPQLGSTVMMTGGALAFAIKNIALQQPLKSGRYVISFEKELLPEHRTRHYKRQHKRHTKVMHKAISAM